MILVILAVVSFLANMLIMPFVMLKTIQVLSCSWWWVLIVVIPAALSWGLFLLINKFLVVQ